MVIDNDKALSFVTGVSRMKVSMSAVFLGGLGDDRSRVV